MTPLNPASDSCSPLLPEAAAQGFEAGLSGAPSTRPDGLGIAGYSTINTESEGLSRS